jgi:hypothetical protein
MVSGLGIEQDGRELVELDRAGAATCWSFW